MRDRLYPFLFSAGLFGILTASRPLPGQVQPVAARLRDQPGTFMGAQSCAACHPEVYGKWRGSRHSKMVQPATAESVKGDFARQSVWLRGKRYRLRAEKGKYFISESYLSDKEQEHRVEYTLGNRRIQHYLTTLADGRIVVLPPSWDVGRRQWFHNMEIVGPEESAGVPVQLWNKNCFGCHVSREQKNYDPATKTYSTAWLDFGNTCENCHGPGSRHVERYTRSEIYRGDPENYIVQPNRLDPVTNSMVCAQCHANREIMAPGFTAGADYYDYFLPLLEYGQTANQDPVYWADGTPRRFSNDALGMWQSECFLKGGVACTGCHLDPHDPEIERNPQLQAGNNTLCTGCHGAIGQRPSAHTHHPPESAGGSCIECHMPKTVVSIKASMRDHTIGIPAPENTIRFGIPNACNVCHQDRSPEWALAALKRWYPGSSREKQINRAVTFAIARAGDPQAVERLIAMAANETESPLRRANALGYLARYPDSRGLAVLIHSMRSVDPLIRTVAALKIGVMTADVSSAVPSLVEALSDPRRVVRMSAAFSLMNLGINRLQGEDGRRFEIAKRDYVIRAGLNADDAITQMDLGKFYLVNENYEKAVAAFNESLSLDPDQTSIHYFLALGYLGQRELAGARELLNRIQPADPYFELARNLLKKLEGQR